MDYFTIVVEGHRHMPAYKAGQWDGKIRLMGIDGKLYKGLLHKLFQFAEERKYNLTVLEEPKIFDDPKETPENYIRSLGPSKKNDTGEFVEIEPRDYQEKAVNEATGGNRAIVLSPTASGKSLMIYALVRWYDSHSLPGLIIVPTTSLVEQIIGDFEEYSHLNGWDVQGKIHKIYQGHSKETDKSIVVTTWQSVFKLDPEWFKRFRFVIVDEAHQAEAKSLKRIMENLTACPYRFGLTGTLRESKTNKATLEGLFGEVFRVATTRELMDNGQLAKLQIKVLKLMYPEDVRRYMQRKLYQEEIDFLACHSGRNSFVANLAASRTGNTMVLFNRLKHGKRIYKKILNQVDPERKVYFITGKTKTSQREEARKIVNAEENAIIVASYGVFSTGINIERLNHVILASPSKSKVRILQSIGRGLRTAHDKFMVVLYDLGDDLTWKKAWVNHTLRHLKSRLALYASEKFNYKMILVEME